MDLALTFLTLGGLFLAGLAADEIGRRTRLPRVTLLLAVGLIAGRSGFDLIPREFEALFEFLSVTALTMVAFVMGNAFTAQKMLQNGRVILWVSGAIVTATLIIVGGGLIWAGLAPATALILASIATATAPAATQDIIHQSGQTGPFPDTLKGIVAVDDAWGLIVFSFILVFAAQWTGQSSDGILLGAARETLGALALGAALGLPAAYLTGRLKRGEPQQTEALGLVCLTAGLAIWFHVSFLLAGMVAGAIVANRARHHERAFHEIENLQWPFMLLFFILAGASLELGMLVEIGALGAAYVVLRIVARILGGWLGAKLGGAARAQRPWFGVALMPQAGVAVGMALVASETFPELAPVIMTLTVGTTVVFELLGPPLTLLALNRVERSKTSVR
ncbi:cation:proton antiporter [Fontisubflavum oceani]|uniref:cation:proton antiporter n=1 Tax=Fontisubflavum oceani TaxID=2978973 RepID=UPI0025B61086|nr:cation:proton antiporter [Fontisubflavum oceani]WJY23155.1 cation:proton antiporter [Fontisubflavum oceani]